LEAAFRAASEIRPGYKADGLLAFWANGSWFDHKTRIGQPIKWEFSALVTGKVPGLKGRVFIQGF
jgi:hypothetical protein